VMLAVVVKEQRFSAPLAFVIAGARTDHIDMTPVMFWLRMHEWIAVNLAGARLQDLRLQTLREAQHIDRTYDAGLRGLDGIMLVVDWRGRAGKIINLINLHIKRIDYIMTHQFEAWIGEKTGDVAPAASVEIIDTQH